MDVRMKLLRGAARVYLAFFAFTLGGCGSLVREVLGRNDPQTAVTVRCGEGGEGVVDAGVPDAS